MKAHGFMKTFGIFSTCLLLLVGIAGLSFAAEVKFGKMSLADVRKNSAKVKASLENLQKVQTEALAKINSLKQETEKLQEKLKSEKDSLKKEEKEKLQAELARQETGVAGGTTSGQDKNDLPTKVDPECGQRRKSIRQLKRSQRKKVFQRYS